MTQFTQTQQPFFFVALPRLVAKSLGLTRYITLDPCAQGHAISRYVSDGQCVQCCRNKLKARYQKNPEIIAELNRKHNPLRRAAVIQRTPPWLTDDHKQAMYEIYKAAHSQGLHVDHIVPLRGKTVSGLHVPWNLRPLSPTENSRKRNNFEVEQ